MYIVHHNPANLAARSINTYVYKPTLWPIYAFHAAYTAFLQFAHSNNIMDRLDIVQL